MCVVSLLHRKCCYQLNELMTAGDDIPWIQSLTKLPLIIKGIQCVEV